MSWGAEFIIKNHFQLARVSTLDDIFEEKNSIEGGQKEFYLSNNVRFSKNSFMN